MLSRPLDRLHDVYLGVGSNIDAPANVRSGVHALRKLAASMTLSPVYQSAALGFDGDDFLNFVVHLRTSLDLSVLAQVLRQIEIEHGRPCDASKYSARTLDIDILLFDQVAGVFDGMTLPRSEILTSAFVLLPLAELAPNLVHPICQQSLSVLAENTDMSSQVIRRIDFNF